MADEFKDALFYKIDVDENDETAQDQKIQAMPTFKCYKNGEKVSMFISPALKFEHFRELSFLAPFFTSQKKSWSHPQTDAKSLLKFLSDRSSEVNANPAQIFAGY